MEYMGKMMVWLKRDKGSVEEGKTKVDKARG